MKIMFICLSLIFISCSSKIKVKPNANRFLTAESQGKSFHGDAALHLTRGTQVSITLSESNIEEALEDENESGIDQILPSLSSSLGIYGPLDLYYVSGGGSGAPLLGAKLQLLGNTRVSASAYNFSFAVYAAGGGVNIKQENDEAIELIATDEEATTELQVNQQTLGALISYRPENTIVLTLGYHVNKHFFKGELESESTILNGKTIEYYGLSHLTTFGIRFDQEKLIFNIEVSNEQTKWDHTEVLWDTYVNANIGLKW